MFRRRPWPDRVARATHREQPRQRGETAREIRIARREFTFRYRSPNHWVDVFRTYYGPTNRTFAALDATKQTALTRDLLELIDSRNRSGDRTMVVESEYLEVVVEQKR